MRYHGKYFITNRGLWRLKVQDTSRVGISKGIIRANLIIKNKKKNTHTCKVFSNAIFVCAFLIAKEQFHQYKKCQIFLINM